MIEPKLLKLFQKICIEVVYQNDECIIYSGHIPKFGFILLEGKAELHLSRSKKTLDPLTAYGFKELAANEPFKHSVKLFEGSRILLVDKSTLITIAKYKAAKDFMQDILGEAS